MCGSRMDLEMSGGAAGKEPACQCKSDPWVGKIPWSRRWQPTPVVLPGESLRQRSLAGQKELDTIKVT